MHGAGEDTGDFRTGRPTLTGAENDLEAARAFLSEYSTSPHTRRRYEAEVTRLFYRSARQGKTVSALKPGDYDAYAAFPTRPAAGEPAILPSPIVPPSSFPVDLYTGRMCLTGGGLVTSPKEPHT